MQESAMTNTERGSTPQAGVIIGTLIAVTLLIAGLWVGFAERTPVRCGSVLDSAKLLSASDALVCDRALGAATTWTWMLIGAAVLSFAVGLVITVIMRNAERAKST